MSNLLHEVSEAIYNGDLELVDGCLIDTRFIYVCGEGGDESEYPTSEYDHFDAVEEYVSTWGETNYTIQVNLVSWCKGIDLATGKTCRRALKDHCITIYPEEQKCVDGHTHYWSALGDEWGGSRGHGGGVRTVTVCLWCGKSKCEDGWADDGHGGHMESVSYSDSEIDEETLREYRIEEGLEEEED